MKSRHTTVVGLIAALLPLAAPAQAPSPDEIRTADEAHRDQAIALYREFLALPNDAVYADDIARLVTWMEKAFESRSAHLFE